MNKKVIPSDTLDKLEVLLKECVHALVISRSQAVTHVRPANMRELALAMTKVTLDSSKYNILLEEEAANLFSPKFVNYGYYFTNLMLAKKFGGCDLITNIGYCMMRKEVCTDIMAITYQQQKKSFSI